MSKDTQVKNKVGRPPKYKTKEEMQLVVDEYFKQCVDKQTKTTLPGLIYHLGFASRQSYYDLEAKHKFSYILKKARLKLEEGHLIYGRSMDIFVLKNHYGYVDKTEVDNKHTFEDMDDDELDRRIRELNNAVKR